MIKLFKKILSCVFIIGIFVLVVAGLILMQSYKFWFQSPASDAEVVTFLVADGASFSSITDELHQSELISSKFWFKVYGKVDGSARALQSGVFELQEGMSYSSIVDALGSAEVDEISMTIPEGYTLKQIGEVVREKFDVSEAEWGILTGMESPFEDHPFVKFAQKPEDVDLEGYLFPDTYRFFKEATGEEIVEKLLDTMQSRISNENVEAPEGWSLHGVLTLASILEREVMLKEEKAIVADLFLRRLEIGMALQADSTVNYVTGKKTPGISLADRDIESPYNTYQNTGLPPGPISNPGIDAIIAVVEPIPNSFLFFLTTPEGEVIYGLTHDDHVRNKNKYLR